MFVAHPYYISGIRRQRLVQPGLFMDPATVRGFTQACMSLSQSADVIQACFDRVQNCIFESLQPICLRVRGARAE
eukprot:15458083-Alexandrium_andersonii.AAC.1